MSDEARRLIERAIDGVANDLLWRAEVELTEEDRYALACDLLERAIRRIAMHEWLYGK